MSPHPNANHGLFKFFCDLHHIVRQLTYALPLRDYLNFEDILRLPEPCFYTSCTAAKKRHRLSQIYPTHLI